MSKGSDADAPDSDPQGAVIDVLTAGAPPGSHDHERHQAASEAEAARDDVTTDEEAALASAGALEVLRRGIAVTPELRRGLALTSVLAVATAMGNLAVPVLIHQVLGRGVLGPDGYRPRFVAFACAGAVALILVLYAVSRSTFLRLITAAENSLRGLRLRTFDHVHRLSMAEHSESRRGVLVSRVTSDVETLAQFTEWGAVAWIVDSVLIVTTLLVLAVYSWQLCIVTIVVFVPLLPIMRALQRRQLAAYDEVRSAVGGTLSEVSEVVTGAPVVLAYGLESRARGRLDRAIQRQYRAQMGAAKWFSVMFPLAELFGALALAAVITTGVLNGDSWGVAADDLIAVVFLVNLLLIPVAELTEILDQTQTAIAGWRKILGLLATPVDVDEPTTGADLPTGALPVSFEGVRFGYRGGPEVLRGINVDLPAGASVAIVGETGSGKTTLARLLCRLADPTSGVVRVGGRDVRSVSPASRRRAIRMVPQDGFLFDTTLRDNVALGSVDATVGDGEIVAAFESLGLAWWLDELPEGLDTAVGERGGNLSVGERQLVALARAQLGDAGVLILDEATSSVDPETEQAIATALDRLASGRTLVSIAHRLSTAERADLVIVVEAGEIVAVGPHDQLVHDGGVYARLYESWLGNTREDGQADQSDGIGDGDGDDVDADRSYA